MFLKALVLFTLFLTYAHSEKAKKNYTTLEPEWDVKDFVPKRYSLQQMNKHLIVGYFPSWSEGSAQDDQPTAMRITPGYVNTLLIAFARSNLRYKKGSYDISETGITTPYDGEGLLNSVKWLKKRNITVILSLGGQTYWQHAIHSDNPPSWDIDYQQIKDLLDDMYIDGIDWDYEPGSEMYPLAEPKHINKFIDFIVKSRQMMPKDLNYLIAAAPSGVGAFGGQINDDPQSPYSFSYGQSLGNVNAKADLFNAETATLFGFATSGHFIPVMKACGEMLDIIVYQGYNCGGAKDRSIMYDGFNYYAQTYGFAVVAGVHVHDEPWGPYFIFSNEVIADLSLHILNGGRQNHYGPYDGIMLWDMLSPREKLSKNNNAYRFCMVAHVILMEKGTKEQALKAAKELLPPHSAPSVWKPKFVPWGPEVCSLPTWVPKTVVDSFTKVYYQGFVYENKYYANPDDIPGTSDCWSRLAYCQEEVSAKVNLTCGRYTAYKPMFIYEKSGAEVIYQGKLYTNKYWAQNNDPDAGEPWASIQDPNGCDVTDPSNLKTVSIKAMSKEEMDKYLPFAFVDPKDLPVPTTKAPTTKAPTTTQPPMEETTKAPMEEKTTKAPMEVKTTQPPMEETTKAPMEVKTTQPPMEETTKAPMEVKTTQPPMEETTKAPMEVKTTQPPMEEKTTQPPMEEKTTKAPIVEETTKPPALPNSHRSSSYSAEPHSVQPESLEPIQPPMEETTKAPMEVKTTQPPMDKKDKPKETEPLTLDQMCGFAEWIPGIYNAGEKVYKDGYIWEAKWYAPSPPGTAPWRRLEICGKAPVEMTFIMYCGAKAYEPKVYGDANTMVYLDGNIWKNQYWAGAGSKPNKADKWGPWKLVKPCDETIPGNKKWLSPSNMTKDELKMFAAAGETDLDTESKSGSIVPIVIPVLVVLALILAAAGFYYQRQKKNKDVLANLQNFESEMGKFNKPLAQ